MGSITRFFAMNRLITGAVLLTLLTACGEEKPTTPEPVIVAVVAEKSAPIVSLIAEPEQVLLTTATQLTWSATDASSCVASDAWTGTKNTEAEEAVTVSVVGTNTFTITCTGPGGQGAASAVIEGYKNTEGAVIDGYISDAVVFIDENGDWMADADENASTSDENGRFTIKHSNGNWVSLGGTDIDSQIRLDNFLMVHNVTNHSDFKVITPITSIATFLSNPANVNAVLGLDGSIDISTFDPVANKGDGGINDYFYEKSNQLTVLAYAVQNITNSLRGLTDTTQDYFEAISAELDAAYIETDSPIDIESVVFITAVLENVILTQNITLADEAKSNIVTAMAGVLPIIEVKATDELTTSLVKFATSTFQADIQAIANGTASEEVTASYTSDLINYIATNQTVSADSITPEINALDDSITTNEDTAIEFDVLSNDTFIANAPIDIIITDAMHGTITLVNKLITFTPEADYNGSDSFSYTISQGQQIASANVTVTITSVNDVPIASAANYYMNLQPKSQTSGYIDLAGTDQDGDTLTFTIASTGSLGELSLSGAEATYQTYSSTQSAQLETFDFIVNDGTVDSSSATVTIDLRTDPLYQYQWHLNNTGQRNFATTAGTPGADLNVDTVISAGITGDGVTVAVIDTGLEIAHEDLVDNVVSGSWDFLNGDADPTNSANDGDHGTGVAGIIAATGWNNLGGRGVAPNASLVGYNWLKNTTVGYQVQAWGVGPPVAVDVDIFNMSYGMGYAAGGTTYSLPRYLEATLEEALQYGVGTLRDGKGAIYIKASGNGFSTNANSDCGTYFSCTETMIGNYNSVPYIIPVSSLNADDVKSSYSTPGSGLWISGFGGEYGANETYVSASVEAFSPAIMTTDQTGCINGYVGVNGGIQVNSFDNHYGGNAENSNCNYSSMFNGTSSAAPSVAGVVALMLEANPDLTWRDVKHILAITADQVDSSNSYEYRDVIQYEWGTNSAGYKFHNWYGFGKVDADEAVTTATGFSANSKGDFVTSGFTSSGAINSSIPDGGANTTSSITVAPLESSNDIVEYVRVSVNFDHNIPKSIALRLLSPDGTVVNIMQPMTNVGTNPNSVLFDIGVSALYGESMAGTWTLVANDAINDGTSGSLRLWGIEVYGN